MLELPPIVPATYSAGTAILIVGLIVAFRRDMLRVHGLDKVICLGPVFFAVPLAVFGAEHLTATKGIASMVPQWIPWHTFWAVFVGVALIAAALSIAVERLSGLASALLGVMFFGFVVLMDAESVARGLGNRFSWTLLMRELSFSLCALAFASTRANDRWRLAGQCFATAARLIVGPIAAFYGVQYFLHPQSVPVIPLEMELPSWIPLHPLWSYGVGAAMIAAGLAMLANWRSRMAATILGIVVCVVIACVYLPILVAYAANIGVGMNYFADTLCFGGAVLILAGSIPSEQRKPSAIPGVNRAMSSKSSMRSKNSVAAKNVEA